MEVVYLWPVDSRAAVCNFKAKVGDKEYPLVHPYLHLSTHSYSIIFYRTRYEGELREKKAAFNKYDEAISESHGAFLMEKGRREEGRDERQGEADVLLLFQSAEIYSKSI